MRRPIRRAHLRRVAGRSGLSTIAFSLGVLVVGAGQAQATMESFTSPGCSNWTVPAGVSAARITATGAAGQAGMRVLSPSSPSSPSGAGGAGGVVSGTLSGLEAGEVLEVCVDQGSGGSGVDPDGGGGGVGGGASGIALGGEAVLIAGGGGGGGDGGRFGSDQVGGNAVLPDGLPGQDAPAQPGALGGGGGTQTQGGAGGAGDSSSACGVYCGAGHSGTGGSSGAPGSGGLGGQIVTVTGGGGGGGGGGYYGGGGGGSGATPCTNCGHSGGAGGGGGSDFCATSLPTATLSGCAATGDNASFTTASVVVSYPVAPPAVSITAPANGASYVLGQAASSNFGCDDGAGGSWLVSCLDQSGHPSGLPLDTSALGAHTFTVTATTRDGMTGTASVTYQVRSGGGSTHPPQTRIGALHIHGRTAIVIFSGTLPLAARASASASRIGFKCKLDKGRFKPCTSPKKYKRLKPGRHTVQVEAINHAGIADPTPAKRTFKIR